MSNIFEKIQAIRIELREQKLTPTGKNAFAKYNYFELDDFLPQLNRLMQKYKMTAIASFTKESATLTAVNIENPEDIYTITSPFGTAELKGCHEVQCIGAVETYQRRYLYQALFDIGEKDCLNATNGKDDQQGGGAKQPSKPGTPPQKASAAEATQKSSGMTMEQAFAYTVNWGVHKGKPFESMPESYLRWVYENAKDAEPKEAARLVLQSIENTKKAILSESQVSMDDCDNKLPF